MAVPRAGIPVRAERLAHPQFWLPQEAGRQLRRRFGHIEPLPADEPGAARVCWYEADAYARWPQAPAHEAEEKAARGLTESVASTFGTRGAPRPARNPGRRVEACARGQSSERRQPDGVWGLLGMSGNGPPATSSPTRGSASPNAST